MQDGRRFTSFAKCLHRQELHKPEGQPTGMGHDHLQAAVGLDLPRGLCSWPTAREGLNPPSPRGLDWLVGMPGSEDGGRPREEGSITRAQFKDKGRLAPVHSDGKNVQFCQVAGRPRVFQPRISTW
jgi:hypothetical protein